MARPNALTHECAAEVARMDPLTVRIPVAVKLTGIGRSKLYELIRAGELDVVKVGTATLVTMTSLRRLAERGSA
ncbi:helix-turn-helix domain-containing protein [uncultured Sphingomonas sp.]|uniref:helix-turn-helix domain-containing protein n=1 Tax=uncultured Sphingomonas sp. TaxID=158754 RepID=UPI0035CCA3DB